MNENVWPLILLGGGLLAFLLVVSFLSKNYSLNNFKNKTVGDGQHGTARWATPREISKTYRTVPFRPRRWRKGEDLPTVQGLVLGSVGGRNHKSEGGFLLKTSRKLLEKLRRPVEGKRKTKKNSKSLSKVKKMIEEQRDIRALVDSDDVHCLMIGASGVGKTAFFLYPNLEYACACGMSYLALDTKGDLARNYGCIASKYYGYQVTVIDLRNPTCSDGFNFMTLVNHYMDKAKRDPNDLPQLFRVRMTVNTGNLKSPFQPNKSFKIFERPRRLSCAISKTETQPFLRGVITPHEQLVEQALKAM